MTVAVDAIMNAYFNPRSREGSDLKWLMIYYK